MSNIGSEEDAQLQLVVSAPAQIDESVSGRKFYPELVRPLLNPMFAHSGCHDETRPRADCSGHAFSQGFRTENHLLQRLYRSSILRRTALSPTAL